ncbi:glycoside hydrolase family 97 protein [Arcticibacterium luteifluviistationis]|uniref:Alpha-glucosidase n=1 Tax=Arcticibacterium luteifluviistationis TaxID=1784714 RepID=A0A2Z4G930_9BACT|nr:glycoside hydrolase family 97 protein [Arcticibacterium luteifluviistationis]AWV97644.1 alpha-glucosidase [Arcticibacterium luteifluviistationis]
MSNLLKIYGLGISLFLTLVSGIQRPDYIQVSSPDGSKTFMLISLKGENNIRFSILNNKQELVLPSDLTLISKELDFKGKLSILKTEKVSIRQEWSSTFAELNTIPDNYNQIKVYLKKGKAHVNLICRAYNEGIAFSYEIPEQTGVSEIGLEEIISYNFKDDYQVWSTPKREKGVLTAQGEYRKIPLSQLEEGCERPLLIDMGEKLKVALAEAKLINFARLSYTKGNTSAFSILSTLDGEMATQKQDTITGAIISESLKKGAKVYKQLPFQSPWRVIMIAQTEGELLENNYIIPNLNDPSKIKDESWITPGKVLRETTLTTEGGYAAINFVAEHNMQYVLFDAGWYGNEMYDNSDATTITPDPKRTKGPFDIESICKYAGSKGIKVILYVNRRALEKQLDEVLPLFKKWGVSGIKFGFVRVGDQNATNWLHEAIKKAAEYEMIVDVHDEYRPTGFSRTYPNLLTQEGIAGDETSVTNEHTLISLFTRMLAGAADNTVCYYNNRVDKMGSRASQLAKTVCLFSPLQFLYWYDKPLDSPEKTDGLWGDSRHIGVEPELAFFDAVPTTWDKTKVIIGEIGAIGVIARKKGKQWFIGGINGTEERKVTLNFSFLEKGHTYRATVYTDDPAVNTRTHVKIEELKVTADSKLELVVRSNNGFAIQIDQIVIK